MLHVVILKKDAFEVVDDDVNCSVGGIPKIRVIPVQEKKQSPQLEPFPALSQALL